MYHFHGVYVPFSVCKYTVHERCVGNAPLSCISTYVKSRKTSPVSIRMWQMANRIENVTLFLQIIFQLSL